MIVLSLFIGFFATILGALPPGASNMAVIKTSINNSTKESLKISYGAGFGEMTLALVALFFGIAVKDFFNENVWVQYAVAMILVSLGIYLIIKKKKENAEEKRANKRQSKYILGFTLGVINPPVLIYWVVVFSMLHGFIGDTHNISTPWLMLFLTGVFMGKVLTLYGYSKLGCHLYEKRDTGSDSLNRYLGIGLSIVGAFQMIKLLFF